jgi:hypothetical protein
MMVMALRAPRASWAPTDAVCPLGADGRVKHDHDGWGARGRDDWGGAARDDCDGLSHDDWDGRSVRR